MQTAIEHGPSFAWLRVKLEPGETIEAEAGAMVTRSASLDMSTRLNAGRKAGFFRKLLAVVIALARKLLGGETMFINEFGGADGGEVVLAPALSGQIVHHQITGGRKMLVQAGSYLASAGEVDTRLRWGGLRTLFGGEGLFLLESSGDGDVFVNAYGGILEVPVDGTYVVDTGHVVAFDDTLSFTVRGSGGLKALFFSGEGLVCEFSGRGRLYLQSRNIGALVGWLTPFLRR
jgi:uncharacterized protein (TIGR00266 family)